MTAAGLEDAVLYDEQFKAECKATTADVCLSYGKRFDDCSGCPAYESSKARAVAREAAEPRPDVRPAAGEGAP